MCDVGEIVYVHVLGRPMIILNSFDAAKELLEKRGVNYSDRPRLVFIQEMYFLVYFALIVKLLSLFTGLNVI